MENENLTELLKLIEASELDVSDWLLLGLKKKSLAPLFLADEPSIIIQLRNLFFALPPLDQTKFRRIIITAMQKWHPTNHGLETFEKLVLLSSYTRTYDALDLIRKRIDEFLENSDSDAYDETLGILFGVLAGFAPDKMVLEVLQKFFYSPKVKYKYLAQIFIGLCICKPAEYTNYIPRLLNNFMKYSTYFKVEYIMATFVENVGLKVIADNFFSIQENYKEYFLELLCRNHKSPSKMVFTVEEGWCLKAKSDYKPLGPDYSRDTQLYPIVYSIRKSNDIQHIIRESLGIFDAKIMEVGNQPVEYVGMQL
jgi:hypothetical protein